MPGVPPVGMSPTELAGWATAITGAITTLLGVLFGKPLIDSLTRLREQNHNLRMSERAVARAEKLEDDKRRDEQAALQRAHEEKLNDTGHKGIIRRQDAEIKDLKTKVNELLDDAGNCHETCARLETENAVLKAENAHLREEVREVREDARNLRAEIDRMREGSQILSARIERLERGLSKSDPDMHSIHDNP